MKAVRKTTMSRKPNENRGKSTNTFDDPRVSSSLWQEQNMKKQSKIPIVTPPTTVELRGVPIHFPFKPYKCQEEYMTKVIDALLRSQNALLESPTGTGKTLCLLCSTLAFQREQARLMKSQGDFEIPGGNFQTIPPSALGFQPNPQQQHLGKLRVPVIIYASRTHSQLSQVVRELRNTRYRPKHAVLGSREQMCVNPKVNKPDGTSTASTINHDCSVITKDRRCKFRNNVDDFKPPSNESSSQDAWNKTQPVLDMEDLLKMGTKHNVCPFYYTRAQVGDAELVLLPYNYLFDKDSRNNTLKDIPWKDAIVIFDEAHNLESFASDSASFDISSKDIAGCMSEIDKALNLSESHPDRFPSVKVKNLLRLKALFLNLEEYIMKKLPQQSTSYQGERIMEIFQKGANITYDNCDLVLAEIKKIFDMFLEVRGGNSKGAPKLHLFVQCLKRIYGESSHARCLAKAQSYRVHLTQTNNNDFDNGAKGNYRDTGRILSYWCFAPSEAMRELQGLQVRSILVTSGTLSPLESYALELGIPFQNRLENPHIIHSNQIHVRVMGRGVNDKELSSSYERRQNNEYYVELGNTLASLSCVIPCGMLVFFPSYGVMETAIERWGGPSFSRSCNPTKTRNFFAAKKRKLSGASGKTGRHTFPRLRAANQTRETPWRSLLSSKALIVEPRSSSDLADAIADFHKFLNLPNSNGVVLFGVCRGKISEGIDFSHDMCRAVIITGLPFAPSFDPKVKMKREFLDQKKARQISKVSPHCGFGTQDGNENNSLSGHDWYTQQAHRAVNQAIGRVIRNKRDYGAVILMDTRFGFPGNQNGLSKWLRPHILPDEGFGRANESLEQFYIDAREASREGESLEAQQIAEKPTNVSMILKYEDDDEDSKQVSPLADEDGIQEVAFIRNESVEKAAHESANENYIKPQRIIARVNMHQMSRGHKSITDIVQSDGKNISRSVLDPSQSSLSLSKNKRISQGGISSLSPAAHFFRIVTSSMKQDEVDTIKQGVILLKRHGSEEYRTEFITAVLPIIEIILKHKPLRSHISRREPHTLVRLFLQLIPEHFIKEVEQIVADVTFRSSRLREELKAGLISNAYYRLHRKFVDSLHKIWFGEWTGRSESQILNDLYEYLHEISKDHHISRSALLNLAKFLPSELERLGVALGEEICASDSMSKLRTTEKARMGENGVKTFYFRKSYSITSVKGEDKVDGRPSQNYQSKEMRKKEDRRQSFKTGVVLKVKNPYAQGSVKNQLCSVERRSDPTAAHSLTHEMRNDTKSQLDSDQSCSSLNCILRQSRSDVFSGETKKLRRTLSSSNTPKDVACNICEKTQERLYISECGHIGCIKCWHEWLRRRNTCFQCRKPTSIDSLALAVFKEKTYNESTSDELNVMH